ncbi:hypothetical protein [Kordia sp.]|uniref:hypothetical protein n=1 Tax=Kordia sp. TaxID=1965332 RepID=UPI003D6B3949
MFVDIIESLRKKVKFIIHGDESIQDLLDLLNQMEIEFLIKMQENPKPLKTLSRDRGLSIEKIEEFELLINNGNLFPKAYKEY